VLFGKSVLGPGRRDLTRRRAKKRFRKVSSIGNSYTPAALPVRDNAQTSYLFRTVEAKASDA
jgi:hypothetical protein